MPNRGSMLKFTANAKVHGFCVFVINWQLYAQREAPVISVAQEANFEVFRPTGVTRCTDVGVIWHRGGDRSSVPNFTPISAMIRV